MTALYVLLEFDSSVPGPDGLSMSFLLIAWTQIEDVDGLLLAQNVSGHHECIQRGRRFVAAHIYEQLVIIFVADGLLIIWEGEWFVEPWVRDGGL